MHVIKARNVNDAFPKMLRHLDMSGIEQKSRAGDVLVAPTPVTTVYSNPRERVLFSPWRDANPFFHLIEALWMLTGRRDVKSMHHYVRRMAVFSDDGETFHGAYGYRWRKHFGGDQIEKALYLLKETPFSRRAVIQIWDCGTDLREYESSCRDVPCNLIITPWLRQGRHELYLDITVFCRSNDVIWGAAGVNAVQFSILQEYLASKLDVLVGTYYQISNNFHAYVDFFDKFRSTAHDLHRTADTYTGLEVQPTLLMDNSETFDYELKRFWDWHDYTLDGGEEHPKNHWDNSIFPNVVVPMVVAYNIFRKHKDIDRFDDIFAILFTDGKSDWLRAAFEWMERRRNKQIRREYNINKEGAV